MTSSSPSPGEKLKLPELLAMGIGGMIGGGIFSVLGMAVGISGHAAPLAFLVGSFVALAAGYSYVKLALGFRDDGASFTYLDRAFPAHPNIAGIVGWTVVVGYIGTLALYAFTFGAYGAHLLGGSDSQGVRMGLSAGVLLFFMAVNLRGVQSSGNTEDLIVFTKVILLGIFAVAGMFSIERDHLFPVFEKGGSSVFIAGAMIFVAFEGFQLITNAVLEMENPERNVPRGIYGSIIVTSLIYFGVSVVAVGNLTPDELTAAEEYALAVAAKPALGNAGEILVDLAALLATSSAVNATAFGASRMMAEMATKSRMPLAFSFRSRTDVPWIAVVTLTMLAIGFTLLGGLETIATFSSMTFLLVSIAVSVANLKLRAVTRSNVWLVLLGIGLMATTVVLLLNHLWHESRSIFLWVGVVFLAIAIVEIVFCRRQCPLLSSATGDEDIIEHRSDD
jgi:amino acid transporter